MFACLYAPPRGLAFRGADGVPRASVPCQTRTRCVTNQLVRLAREYSPRIENPWRQPPWCSTLPA